MALAIPANFNNDIQSNHTSIVPLIVIRNLIKDASGQTIPTDAIYLSTNSGNILTGLGVNFKPLLLNVPSLKESIDLETRKYKISSVTLDCSNVEYQGTRLSDEIDEKFGSLMNTEVRIFWSSPSTTDLAFFDIVPYDPADTNAHFRAFQIYTGTVRRYTHTDEKVKIELEDKSQAILDQTIPLENLGDTNDVPDKYKNKPVPMVYGKVDKSPCVLKTNVSKTPDGFSLSDGSVDIYVDRIPLTYVKPHIFLDSGYGEIRDEVYNVHDYNIECNSTIIIEDLFDDDGKPTTPYIRLKSSEDNFISKDLLPILEQRDLKDMAVTPLIEKNNTRFLASNMDVGSTSNDHIFFTTLYNKDSEEMFGTFVKDDYVIGTIVYNWDGNSLSKAITGNGNDVNITNMEVSDDERDVSGLGLNINTNTISDGSLADVIFTLYGRVEAYYGNMGANDWGQRAVSLNVLTGADTEYEAQGIMEFSNLDTTDWVEISNSGIWNGDDTIAFKQSIKFHPNLKTNNIILFVMPVNNGINEGYMGALKVKFKTLWIQKSSLVKGVLDQDYYAGVNGREFVSETQFPQPYNVIKNIINFELRGGVEENAIDFDFTQIRTLTDNTTSLELNPYRDIQHNFTVHQNINAKKLIEEISSASPYVSFFSNQNKFKIFSIPTTLTGTNDEYDISAKDVIDFSFSRTKAEDVVTKVVLKYAKSYARDNYGKSVEARIGANNGDVFSYYKINQDHSESTLIIDDHRSDYIRDDRSAMAFCRFILGWYMNQHLIINIKVPLSVGLPREIGDVIKFDELLGGIKPYGIDYTDFVAQGMTLLKTGLNNQNIQGEFLITKTNKNMEFVEIECIQLHQGMPSDVVFDDDEVINYVFSEAYEAAEIQGCTNQNADNYNYWATVDNGTCTFTNWAGYELLGRDFSSVNWALCNFTSMAPDNSSMLEELRTHIPAIRSIQKFTYDENGINPFNWNPSSKLIIYGAYGGDIVEYTTGNLMAQSSIYGWTNSDPITPFTVTPLLDTIYPFTGQDVYAIQLYDDSVFTTDKFMAPSFMASNGGFHVPDWYKEADDWGGGGGEGGTGQPQGG